MRMIFRAMLVAVGIGLAGPLSASATPLDRLAVDRAPSASETLQQVGFWQKGYKIQPKCTIECVGNPPYETRVCTNLLGQIVSSTRTSHGQCIR